MSTITKRDRPASSLDAYVIADNMSGIPEAMPTIFPGCVVKPWTPVKKALVGHQATACAFLKAWSEEAGRQVGDMVTFRAVQKACGVDARTFKDTVRRSNAGLLAELGNLCIEEAKREGATFATVYRLVGRPA